jgi:hypothetical protein
MTNVGLEVGCPLLERCPSRGSTVPSLSHVSEPPIFSPEEPYELILICLLVTGILCSTSLTRMP